MKTEILWEVKDDNSLILRLRQVENGVSLITVDKSGKQLMGGYILLVSHTRRVCRYRGVSSELRICLDVESRIIVVDD